MVASSLPLLAVLGSMSRPLLRPQRQLPLIAARMPQPLCSAAAIDLVGDGGVLKAIVEEGSGGRPPRGASVEVHYEGRLVDTGAVFDSSRARGKTFKFTLGEGKVIGGWEVGLSSMQIGERCTLTCAPQYAYGAKGVPPMIPPSAALIFDVELVDAQLPRSEAMTFADDNPTAPRTPADIKSAYETKMAAKPAQKEGLEGAIEWLKSIYIFGLFSSKGERPPWYINPLITFPAIFAIVAVGFWAVIALDGVHRGEVPQSGDDLTEFIGETMAP